MLAGGQSLVPLMNQRRARPAVLVDITRLPGLGDVTDAGGRLRVGALVTQAAFERVPGLAGRCPIALECAPVHRAPRDTQPRHGRRVDRPRGPARRAAARAARPRRRGRGRERRRAADDRGGGPLHRAVREGAGPRRDPRRDRVADDGRPARTGLRGGRPAPRGLHHRLGRGRSARRGRGRRVGAGRRRRGRRPAAARPRRRRRADRPGARRGRGRGGGPRCRGRDREPARGHPRQRRLPPPPRGRARRADGAARVGAGGRVTAPGDEVVAVELTVNGRRYRELVEPRLLLADFLRHAPRADRHARRLRARRLRRLHRPPRRRRRPLVPRLRRPGRRLRGRRRSRACAGTGELTDLQQRVPRATTRCSAASARPAC